MACQCQMQSSDSARSRAENTTNLLVSPLKQFPKPSPGGAPKVETSAPNV